MLPFLYVIAQGRDDDDDDLCVCGVVLRREEGKN